jgi:hypothetical protein
LASKVEINDSPPPSDCEDEMNSPRATPQNRVESFNRDKEDLQLFQVNIEVKKSPRPLKTKKKVKYRSKSRLEQLLTVRPNSYQQKMI